MHLVSTASYPALRVTRVLQFGCTVIIIHTFTWWLVISSLYVKIYGTLYGRDLQEGRAEAP